MSDHFLLLSVREICWRDIDSGRQLNVDGWAAAIWEELLVDFLLRADLHVLLRVRQRAFLLGQSVSALRSPIH